MMPIVTPNSGEEAGSPASRAAVSYIRDHPVLYDDLSLREHLAYPTRLHGSTPEQHEAERLIAELGVAGRQDDLPSTFSRGLRQKTAIVVALCRPFALLLVDEPFSGLDRAVMLSNGELVFDGPQTHIHGWSHCDRRRSSRLNSPFRSAARPAGAGYWLACRGRTCRMRPTRVTAPSPW